MSPLQQTQFDIANYLLFCFFFVLTVGLLILTEISRKWYMLIVGFYYLFKSKDAQCRITNGTDILSANTECIKSIKTKRLILIRHGESIWNELFNRKTLHISFPFRFIKIFVTEIILFLSKDSYLFDSPLSNTGIQQCGLLRSFLSAKQSTKSELLSDTRHTYIDCSASESEHITECINILNNNNNHSAQSLIVCSPLRRCIETVSLSLYDRLNSIDSNSEKIYLLSTLQELTRNIDGLSLSVNNSELPPISKHIKSIQKMNANGNAMEWKQWFTDKIDSSMTDGVKSKYKRGDDRINGFVEWIFCAKNNKYDNIIVGGHSIWFRMFLKSFLPSDVCHIGKEYKIQNGGVVSLELTQYLFANGGTKYSIDPNSIHVIFKGFETQKHRM